MRLNEMKIILKCKKNTHYAIANFENGKVTVLKDSKIYLPIAFEKMSRDALEARNDSSIVDEKGLVLKDVSFNSVTTAAQFVTGRSVNGLIAWRIDDKISLKEYYKQKGN